MSEADSGFMEAETPEDLRELAKVAAVLKNEITETEDFLKRKKDRFNEISDRILKTLELLELDNIRAHGFLFFKEVKSSVVTPKTVEDKQKLFDYLKEKGIFMEFASVNSQSLNALYKSLAEEALKEGVLDFRMPGVPEPTSYTTLKLRKG